MKDPQLFFFTLFLMLSISLNKSYKTLDDLIQIHNDLIYSMA